MKSDPVDFLAVEAKHEAIHIRLENWAAWCQPGHVGNCTPMFRLYRPDNWGRYGRPMADRPSVDPLDAQRIAKGVSALPEPHMRAIQWFYVKPVSPAKACRMLATNMPGLMQFVRDGRQMLVNRRV